MSWPRAALAGIASLLLAAHLLRQGAVALAVAVALLPLLLAVHRRWAVRTVQLVLVVGAAEWLRTLLQLVEARRLLGQPTTRLAAILTAVTAVTALAAVALEGWRRKESAGEAG